MNVVEQGMERHHDLASVCTRILSVQPMMQLSSIDSHDWHTYLDLSTLLYAKLTPLHSPVLNFPSGLVSLCCCFIYLFIYLSIYLSIYLLQNHSTLELICLIDLKHFSFSSH